MKALHILTLCAALAGTVAHAAQPAALPAHKSSVAKAPAAMAGTWKSTDAKGGTLSGTIELRADGHAVLAADGKPRIEGTWQTKGQGLTFTMPPYGIAQMTYVLTAKELTLTYENGVKQHFTKLPDKK